MEPRTSTKIIVGVFVFAGLLLFAASIFFLGERGRYFAPQHPLKAFFTNAAGLHEGAAVRLAGVPVGRVTAIRLPSPPEQKVLVELNVAGGAIENVRRDSVARIETVGFLGDKFIEISVGSPQEPPLPDGATLRVEEPTEFGTLVGQGQRVLAHAERFAASLERGEGALPWLIQDPASRRFMQDLARTAEALAALSREVKEGRGLAHALIYDPEGSKLVENLTETSEHLKEISEKIARGEGTAGAFLVDPTVYENLTALLEGAQRSWILRWAIRSTLESGRGAREEEAKAAASKK
ncbi:MAG: MlaD family protein [candidate division NC10 bacterium]|nr:MlaD family protein [candidate division NC10 bacterium]